jgi:YD repeat-containing protein
MTIDIRANVYCSLGPVISGNFADEAVQGSGLVKTRGQVELAGVFRPDVGQVVEFAWTRGTIGARLPRKLRVLSSFADPFRAITTVQIGCKLTQFEDVTPNVKIKNQAGNILAASSGTGGDPTVTASISVDVAADGYLVTRVAARRAATGGVFVASPLIPTEAAEREAILKEYTHLNRYVTFPLSAARIVEYLCSYMKITLAAAVPLVNQYVAVKEFDLRNGILPLLSDLLISENYFGYLNERERLVIRSLEGDAGVGPVFDSSNIIDLRAIGVGNRPGETVIVNYTTARRLKPEVEVEAEYEPDGAGNEQLPTPTDPGSPVPPPPPAPPANPDPPLDEAPTWTDTTTCGFPVIVPINYTTLAGDQKDEIYSYIPRSRSYSEFNAGKISRSFDESSKPLWAAAPAYTAQRLSFNLPPQSSTCISGSETTYAYDAQGRQSTITTTEYSTVAELAGGLSLQYVFEDIDGGGSPVSLSSTIVTSGLTTVEKTYAGNYERTVTSQYLHWSKTQQGQQGSTEGRLSFESAARTQAYINSIETQGLVYQGTQVEITITSPENPLQGTDQITEPGRNEPEPVDIEREIYSKPPQQSNKVSRNKFNTEVIQESATLIYSYGAVDAERIVSLTIPYTGDDVFDYSDDAGLALGYQPTTFKVQPSPARQKAMAFGRCQNRLLLGNRQGVSIQVPAELMPREPFAPLYINADGLTGQYRCNAASWTFSAEGIVASVDALFWGGIGS